MFLLNILYRLHGEKGYNLYHNLQYNYFRLCNRESIKLLRKNSKFKNIHYGERCFIIGNGPSLKNQDLSLLENEYVFTVNQAPRNKQYQIMHSNYHFFADAIFYNLDKNIPEDNEIIDYMRRINSADNKPECFFPIEAMNFLKENRFNDILAINYFCNKYIFIENYSKTIDFIKYVPGFETVVQFAVIMAIYMGFKEIYLLGCDMTSYEIIKLRSNEVDSDENYSYPVTENEKRRLIKMREKFSAEQTLLGCSKMFAGYRKLRKYCELRQIKLINLTDGGVLDNLKRQKYEDVLCNRKNV